MRQRRILVIEDDAPIRQGISDALEVSGYATEEADNVDLGLDLAVTVDCDLVLLDLILPPGKHRGGRTRPGEPRDGLDILRQIRATRPTLPVIILTARGAEADRVAGLRLGADDYVVKPFGARELLARVEAVLRRSPERPSDVGEIPIPGGVIHLHRREVRYGDGGRRELSEREAELLRYLARNAGRAISREEILSRVWRLDPAGIDTRTIDMTVARLREKLHDEPAQPKLLLTVRGKGYMFAAEEADK